MSDMGHPFKELLKLLWLFDGFFCCQAGRMFLGDPCLTFSVILAEAWSACFSAEEGRISVSCLQLFQGQLLRMLCVNAEKLS